MDTNTIIYIVGGVVLGVILGYIIAKSLEKGKASKIIADAESESQSILKQAKLDGESIKKDKILQAKEKFIELKAEHEKVILSRDKKMAESEKRIRDKESQISNELNKTKKSNQSLEDKIKDYDFRMEFLDKKQDEIEKAHKSQIKQLEVISALSAEEAKEQLIESLKEEAKTDAMGYIQDTVEEAKLTAQQEAKKIIINTIQRIGTEEAVDNCVSVFNIESDDVKGRIIGREGRNIRAIEAATGVEIIVDDTPEAIILSCFDSVRREIARLSLHKLVTDGRIHPARIEEIVKKTEKQIEQEIIEVVISISSWCAPIALQTSGFSPCFSAHCIPKIACGVSTSVSDDGTLPISCNRPALFANLGFKPNSAAITPQSLATSRECCSKFCP